MIASPIRRLLLLSFLVNMALISNTLVAATHEDSPPTCEEPANLLDILACAWRAFYAELDTETQTLELMRHSSHASPFTSHASLDFETSLEVNGTTCPWRMRMTYDAERLPTNIAEAVCECEHCARHVHRRHGNSNNAMCPQNGFVSGRCRPVHGPMVVFRRLCDGANVGAAGVYRYVPELRNVAIGCTCERPQLT